MELNFNQAWRFRALAVVRARAQKNVIIRAESEELSGMVEIEVAE